MADTGKHPSSLRMGLKAIAARVPPHCPAEYETMALGLNEKVLDPK